MLGPLDVRIQGEPLPPLRSRKGRWLLALLLLRANREVAREWLAGTLWPDSDESTARATLRRTLTDLRQALGEQAHRLQSPNAQTLRFDLTGVETDLLPFDTALASGQEARLAEAVALYRGPLLEGCTEEWIGPEREQRTQAYLQMLEKLAEQALLRREHSKAISYLQLLIKTDPLQESAQRSLMRALAESGSVNGAIQSYQEFRRALRRELNADPDPETTRLFQQLRAETPEKPPAPPVPAIPIADPPPVRPVPALPVPLTPFVGRERELRELSERLETTRLLSLVGTGGLGKTRLALRLAEETQERFPDGIWFADLSALSDPALVVSHVATVVQVREQGDRPLLETLCAALASRAALLILDNCEHLLDASAHLAAALLRSCAGLRILATTRQALNIGGEVAWRIPALSLPGSDAPAPPDLPEHLMRYEAIRLFVQRAVAAMPPFALNAASAAATVQICRHLDGIPLALELAAARLNVLSVLQIARRLDDRFRLLTTGSRSAPRRQQTLRAAIDWSYDLLNAPERLLLRRLAIFVGGWTLEAAEAVCADPPNPAPGSEVRAGADGVLDTLDVLDLLAQLVERSLVVVEGGAEGAVRYRLMESIREYALEMLRASGEETLLQDRHRAFYLTFANAADAQLSGAQQATGLQLLETEHDNLRAALSGGEAAMRVKLAGALWRFWWMRGYYTEGRAWLRAALATEGEVPDEFRGRALGGAAALASEQGDPVAAVGYAEQFLAIRRQLGDPVGIARALNNLALTLFFQARYAEARPLLEESLALKRASNDLRGIAQSLGNLGLIANATGDLERAEKLHTECLEISRNGEDYQSVGWALSNLGDVALRAGDLDTALQRYREGLRIAQPLQDIRTVGAFLDRIGIIACRRALTRTGVMLMRASEILFERLGVQRSAENLEERNAVLNEARRSLGDAAIEAACSEGQALTTDQAVALALDPQQIG